MASDKNLQELFHETLKDIYFAEKKILSALPKMAKPRSRKSSKLRSRSTRPRPKNTSRGLRRYSKRSMKRLVAKPAMRSWGSSRKVRT